MDEPTKGQAMNARQTRESHAMIRAAWPNRHTHPLRARTIIRCNIAALRSARS